VDRQIFLRAASAIYSRASAWNAKRESSDVKCKRQTPNAKRQTPNAKRQTPNAKRQTPNAKRQIQTQIALSVDVLRRTNPTQQFVSHTGECAVAPVTRM
jgi:hypothetical protein